MFESIDVFPAVPHKAGLKYEAEGKVFISIFNTGPSAALVAGQPYTIAYKSTALKEVDVAAPATLTTSGHIIGVPVAAIADDAYGWVQIYGLCEVKHAGATTAGHYLEVLNAGTAFTTEGAATKTIASCAVSVDGTAAAATATAFLFGEKVAVLAA
jgi:hypothetical protein